VHALGCEPDGLNINRGVGSTHPETLAQAVRETGAAIGIAFDGDGDRVVMADARGRVIDGDDLLYVLARDWQASGRLRGPVVGTLMTNFGLESAFAAMGVPFHRAKVGDRYVHQMLIERGGVLGGEASGHILCLDRATTGDALVNALQVLEVMQRQGATLAELCEGLRRFPQRTVNVRVAPGARPAEHPDVIAARGAIEQELAGRGRVVLRPSGTEPVVRVTVEAEDAAQVERLVRRLAAAVESAA
jgi:phosphoglucosamine mutase